VLSPPKSRVSCRTPFFPLGNSIRPQCYHTIQPVSQQGSPYFIMVGIASKDDNAHVLVCPTNTNSNCDLKGSTTNNDATHFGPGNQINGNVTNITNNNNTIYQYQCPDPTAHLPKQAPSQPAGCSRRRCRRNEKLLIALLEYLGSPLRRKRK
jgi:hypothetical protein